MATKSKSKTKPAGDQAAECLKILAHPVRLRIVQLLLPGRYTLGALAATVTGNVYLAGVPAFVGAGLMFAGITNSCAMGMLIAKMPWNQCKDGSCSA